MLAVIIAHLNVGILGPILYTFHLPLFFIITGYCFNYDACFKEFFRKKFRGYFIPYVGCSAILIIFEAAKGFAKKNFVSATLHALLGYMVQMRYSALWFLAALFMGTLIFWGIVKFGKNIRTIFLYSCLIGVLFIIYDTYVKVPLPWNLDTAFIIQIFLATGYFIKRNHILKKLKTHCGRNIIVFTSISFVLSMNNYIFCHQPLEMNASNYGIFPLTILAAISGSIAIILISYTLTKCNLLEWLGRNTMSFFAFHQSIAIGLFTYIAGKIGIQQFNLNIFMDIWYIINELVFVLFVCYLIHRLLIKAKLGFVLGKSIQN